MPIPAPVGFGWTLLAGTNTTGLHHHIMIEALTIDHDGAKTWIGNVHARTIRPEGVSRISAALSRDSNDRVDAAFSRDDLEALRREISGRGNWERTATSGDARAGQREVVRWLVAEAADLNHTSKSHLNALMPAVIGNHDEVARLLVQAGADVGIKGTGAPGFAGKTAAVLADDAGAPDLAAYVRRQARSTGPGRLTGFNFSPCAAIHLNPRPKLTHG